MKKNQENNKVSKKININVPEIASTTILAALVMVTIVSAMDMIGLVPVPEPFKTWMGAALMAYAFVGFVSITHTAVVHKLRKV